MNALLHVTLIVAMATPVPSASLLELVANERRFSQTCGEKGIRDSFLEFFADDVITFGPDLQRGTAHLRARPVDGSDRPLLEWHPVYGDISEAGDLGYLTGPYTFTSRAKGSPTPQVFFGMFFSVWRKQNDGRWKVALDAGLPAPQYSGDRRAFEAAPLIRRGKKELKSLNPILDAEHRLARDAEFQGLAKALLAVAASSIRLHRVRTAPIRGQGAARDFLRKNDAVYHFEPMQSQQASSGDLGFAYGRYERKPLAMDAKAESGYFVRVWRRQGNEWRVVLDTLQPLSD